MPHLIIEYSANVAIHHDIQKLVEAAHHAAIAHGLPPLEGMRTRAVSRENYMVADGEPDFAFIALHARIGPGRSDQDKTSFITQVLDAAQTEINSANGPLTISWSIELNEIDPTTRINRNEIRAHMQNRKA